ncbi:MAG: hypothetical protein K2L37_03980, partial [Lactobacillus sp.]|nr:hypothetical protein [Lactobacillus sp.]
STMGKSDQTEEVDPYEPVIYIDPDVDLSKPTQDPFRDMYGVYNTEVVSYSDHLFSDDAVNTKFTAEGGEKIIIPERGSFSQIFWFVTSSDLLHDNMPLYERVDRNGNKCFYLSANENMIDDGTLPFQKGDIWAPPYYPNVAVLPQLLEGVHPQQYYYDYVRDRGIEQIPFEWTGSPTNQILELRPGIDKWLEITIDPRRRTISLKASPNTTGEKRVFTIAFAAVYCRAYINGVLTNYFMPNSRPYFNNAIRVEQAPE